MSRPPPPLVNAEKRAQEFSHFHIPTKNQRNKLHLGELAQVIFDGDGNEEERMWLKIVKVHKDHEGVVYLGIAEHDSKYTDCCNKGMSVEFEPKHILAIMLV